VTIVADNFDGLSTLARHRLIYDALGDAMQTEIHALSIKAFDSGGH
jgi:BolA protein